MFLISSQMMAFKELSPKSRDHPTYLIILLRAYRATEYNTARSGLDSHRHIHVQPFRLPNSKKNRSDT